MKRNWKRILAAVLASTMLLADSSVAFATESVEQMNEETQQEEAVTTETPIEEIPIEMTEQISASEESETTKLFNSLNTDEELTKASVDMIGVGDAFTANYDEDSSAFAADYYFMPKKTGYYGFKGISGRYAFEGHFENEEWIEENEIESYYKLAEDRSTIEKYYELEEGKCYNIHVAAYLDEGESIDYILTEDEAGDTAQTISLDGGTVTLNQGEKKLYKFQTSNPTAIAVKVNGCADIDILDYDKYCGGNWSDEIGGVYTLNGTGTIWLTIEAYECAQETSELVFSIPKEEEITLNETKYVERGEIVALTLYPEENETYYFKFPSSYMMITSWALDSNEDVIWDYEEEEIRNDEDYVIEWLKVLTTDEFEKYQVIILAQGSGDIYLTDEAGYKSEIGNVGSTDNEENADLNQDNENETREYLIDTTHGGSVENVVVDASDSKAKLTFDVEEEFYDYEPIILWTEDEELAKDFFWGTKSVTSDEIGETNFQYGYLDPFNFIWDPSDYYQCKGTGTMREFLYPETTYYYRLAYQSEYDEEAGCYTYYFKTEPQQFTTASLKVMQEVKAQAEGSNVTVNFKHEENIVDFSKYRILYTTDAEQAQEIAAYDVMADEYDVDSYATNQLEDVNCSWDTDCYKTSAVMEDKFYPGETVYFRIVRYEDDGWDGCYYFVSSMLSVTLPAAPEKSEVSISDVDIVNIGYNMVELKYAVSNPLNELIDSVYVEGKLAEEEIYAQNAISSWTDEDTGMEHIIFRTNGKALSVRVCCTVVRSADEKDTVYSDVKVVQPLSLKNSYIAVNENVGSNNFAVTVSVAPWHEVDASWYSKMYLYYRQKDGSWRNEYVRMNDSEKIINLSGLSDGTVYEYYLIWDDLWGYGSAESPKSFTTKSVMTYADNMFDDVLRTYLKSVCEVPEDELLTSADLETVNYISIDPNNEGCAVESLKGIQYCTNLESVYLDRNNITDISLLKQLPKLERAAFTQNNITQLPDLSDLEKLDYLYLDYNRIGAEEFEGSKLPTALLKAYPNWIEDTKEDQWEQCSYFVPEQCYAIKDTQPIIFKAIGIKGRRDYTFTVEIEGETYSNTVENPENYSYEKVFCIEDFDIDVEYGKTYEAKVSLIDEFGYSYFSKEPVKFVFAADEVIAEKVYIRPIESSVYCSATVPGEILEENLQALELKNKSGEIVGAANIASAYADVSHEETRYQPELYGIDIPRISTRVGGTISFVKYLPAGMYDLFIKTTDGEEYKIENTVQISDEAILEEIYEDSLYDQSGDYVYINLAGKNLNGEKLYPVLKKGTNVVAEYAGIVEETRNGIVYRLKKIDKEKNWKGYRSYICEIVAEEGYQYIDSREDKEISIWIPENDIIYVVYNYKKSLLEIKLSSDVKDGTEVKVTIGSSYLDDDVEGTGKGIVENGWLKVPLYDSGNKEVIPQNNSHKFIQCYYRIDADEETAVCDREIEWYNYDSYSSNTRDEYFSLKTNYWPENVKEIPIAVNMYKSSVNAAKALSVELTDSVGTVIGDSVTLTRTERSSTMYAYNGTWSSTNGLAPGTYYIKCFNNEKEILRNTIYVCDDEKFYMNGQSVGTDNDDRVTVTLTSPNLQSDFVHKYGQSVSNEKALEIWNENYVLEIFDGNGNEIKGWKIDEAKMTLYNMSLALSGLPKDYVGFYFKITHKDYGLGIQISTGKAYYSTDYYSNTDFGYWEDVHGEKRCSMSYRVGEGWTSICVDSVSMYPVEVTFRKPCDEKIVSRFVISDDSSKIYDFTTADLAEIEIDEIYTATVIASNGASFSETGYFKATRQTEKAIDVTAVSFNMKTAELKKGEILELLAMITPENATNKQLTWSSSDEAVATVDQNGKITAIKGGKAVITAKSNNGKIANCTISVIEYTISQSELSFDLTSNKKPQTLVVSNGIKNVTASWTSDNTGVVKVSSKGVVTPVGVGNATIIAKINDETVFTCTVTVKNDYLKAIKLDCTFKTMNVGDSSILTVNYIPANTTLDKTVIWESSNSDIAEVDSNGNVKAVGTGTATIKASVLNGTVKNGVPETVNATCKITVYRYGISKDQMILDLQETEKTTLTVTNGIQSNVAATWSSDDQSIAIVDKKGNVTPTGIGKTTITAVIKNGPTLTCEVTVINPHLDSVTLSQTEAEMLVGSEESLKLESYISPTNTTLEKTITWTSSNEEIVTVDEDGNVTAKNVGTAVVKAQSIVNEIFDECTIKVLKNAECVPGDISLDAITNVHKKLGNVALPEVNGGTLRWKNPEIQLAKFAGIHEKSFVAIYEEENAVPVEIEVLVSLTTITKLTITGDKTIIMTDDDPYARLNAVWTAVGKTEILDDYEVNWISKKPDIASVDSDGIVTVNKKGSTVIQASAVVGGKKYTASYSVKVVEGSPAVINVDDIQNLVKDEEHAERYIGNLIDKTGMINVFVENAGALTVTSTDSSVIKLKSASIKLKSGIASIPFEMKSGGTAKITIKAKDALGTTKELYLTVKDSKPSIDTTSLTINMLKEEGAIFHIYPAAGFDVKNPVLSGKDCERFTLVQSENDTEYMLTAKEGTKAGSYKVEVNVTADNNEYKFPVSVKVFAVKAKVTAKQAEKVNIFYNDENAYAVINLTSAETITNAELTDCDFECVDFDSANNTLTIKAKEGVISTKADKTGKLKIELEGWKDAYEMSYTVGMENRAPKLVLTEGTAVFYPMMGIHSAETAITLDGNAYDLTDASEITMTDSKGNEITGYTLTKDCEAERLIVKSEDGAKNLKAILKVKEPTWNKPVAVNCTFKINYKKPVVKLSKATVQLNAHQSTNGFDMVSVQVKWSDTTEFTPDSMKIAAADKNAQKVLGKSIVLDVEDDKIIARLNNQSIKNGNYKFKVYVKANEEYTATTNLTVKVVNVEAKKAIKFSSKGSIDVINRSGSSVIVTPKLISLNGTVINAVLTGRDAHLFESELLVDGTVKITAKENAKLIIGYAYGVNIKLTIANADGKTLDVYLDVTKLTLKQGSVKVVAAPSTSTIYSNTNESKINLKLNAVLKGAENIEIQSIEQMNLTNTFVCNYDEETGNVILNGNSGEIAKGKSYLLQFKVIMEGHADNAKPIIVKYKVTVK